MSEFTGAVYECDLPPRLQAVVLALAQHVNHKRAGAGDYRVWPSVDRLAWMLGIKYRTVQRRLRELEDLGVLVAMEEAGYRTARTYDINLGALQPKPPLEPRKRSRAKGDGGDALKGDAQGLARATPQTRRATLRVEKGDAAVSPEVEEIREEALKEVPESNGLTPPPVFDKEEFFAKKKAQIRDELEEKAAKGSVWAEACLVSLDNGGLGG